MKFRQASELGNLQMIVRLLKELIELVREQNKLLLDPPPSPNPQRVEEFEEWHQ